MGIMASNMSAVAAGGMGIEVDIDPSPVLLVASFNKMSLDIRSFKVPLERSVREVIAPSLRENFDVGGRPEWMALSERTIQRKKGAGDTLVRSGKLRRKAGQINIWQINGEEGLATLQVPGDVWYGKVHQEGSGTFIGFLSAAGGAMGSQAGEPGYVPQRVWALFQEEDIEAIHDVFVNWVNERVDLSLAGLGAPRI